MGRNAQPIEILKAKGRKHLTKAEIEHRKESEIHFGEKKLKCPAFVKNDVIAYKKWKEILKLYKDVDFVSSGDAGLLARYCMTFSEYENLLERREQINAMDELTPNEVLIAGEAFDEKYSDRQKAAIFKKINYIISTDGLLSLETAINKKMDMLIKMEDRLFLNPLAKVKNVPKKEKEAKDPLKERGFGNV